VTTPDGAVATTSYSGNTTTITDQNGKMKVVTSDGLGHISQVAEDPKGLNMVTSYGWSAAGNMTTVTQGTQQRSFTFDPSNRLAYTIEPENGIVRYWYDNVGNVTSTQDARGVTKTYGIDDLNRVTSISYSDGTPAVAFNYDNQPAGSNTNNTRGRLLSVSNSNSTTNFTSYDAKGNVAASSQVTAGHTYNFSYTYNLTSALTSETYPDGRQVTTNYDGANRVSTLSGKLGTANTNYVTQLQYWPNGMVSTLARGNNVGLTTSITNRQQLSCAVENNTTLGWQLWAECLTWNTNNTVNWIRYNNGGAGYPQLLSFVQTFGYDNLNRLTSATDTPPTGSPTNWSRNFNYDQWGNMWVSNGTGPMSGNTPQTNVYAANNKNQDGRWAYDASGNLQTVNGNTATYNVENQITNLSNGPASESMNYDSLGERVQKAYGGTTTVYVYDIFGLAAEYNSAGTWSRDYIRSGRGQLIATENASGGVCATCYFTADHLGGTRIVTDSGANVVARHDYLPFGEEIAAGKAGRDANFGPVSDVTL